MIWHTRSTAIFHFSLIMGLAASATAKEYNCVPLEVAVFGNRVHVECAAPAGKTRGAYPVDTGNEIIYFAVDIKDKNLSTRFNQVANMSITSGMPMVIRYTSGDYSGEVFDCKQKDCRTPEAFGLRLTAHLP